MMHITKTNIHHFCLSALAVVLGVSACAVPAFAEEATTTLPTPPVAPVTPPSITAETSQQTIILPIRVALIPEITPFTDTMRAGDSGPNVQNLQRFLNQHGFVIATTGAGSPGKETEYFGPLTKAAVARYQTAYGAYITSANGTFDAQSVQHANSLLGHKFVNLFTTEDAAKAVATNEAGANASLTASAANASSAGALLDSLSSELSRLVTALQSIVR